MSVWTFINQVNWRSHDSVFISMLYSTFSLKKEVSQVMLEGSLTAFKFNFELAFLLVSGVKKMKLQTTSKTASGWMNVRM